jgi:hypothetical protein
VSRDGKVFFHGGDGFYAVVDGIVDPIGYDHVNRWFLRNANPVSGETVQAIVDPIHSRVYWAFSVDGGSNLDMMLCYDWQLRRWTKTPLNGLRLIFPVVIPAMTLELLDTLYPGGIDTIPFSLDSAIFNGARPLIGGFDASFRAGVFDGPSQAATLTTAEFPIDPTRRMRLTSAYPIVDALAPTLTPQRREQRGAAFVDRSAVSINASGWCPMRSSGRFHRIKMNVPAGAVWQYAQGIDVLMQPEGGR